MGIEADTARGADGEHRTDAPAQALREAGAAAYQALGALEGHIVEDTLSLIERALASLSQARQLLAARPEADQP
jgi:hypothetical protein